MKLKAILLLVPYLCLFAAAAAPAQGARDVRVNFRQTTLENGLRVITVEDHSAPVLSVAVTYAVGSRDERKGQEGFAHLLEHLMFRGSQNVGPEEHAALIQSYGGAFNAWTEKDLTTYFMSLPANQLDLALYLEADRMRGLKITDEGMRAELAVVAQEEQERYGRPYGRSLMTLDQTLYDSFAYRHATLGSISELNAASPADVKAFYDLYYGPGNAVLTLVGDFDSAEALRKVETYFGGLAAQAHPPPPDAVEPEQKRERRLTIKDPLARSPRIDIAFKVTSATPADLYALHVLSVVLQQSKQSSRLFERLVTRRGLAQNAEGHLSSRCGPAAVFYVSVTAAPGADLDEVEAETYAEIDRLKTEAVTDEELKKPERYALSDLYMTVRNSLKRAIGLSEDTVTCHDPNLINTRVGNIAAVTARDVMRVTSRYLVAGDRTVVITLPERAAAR
jgi:zinc protease